MSISCLNRAGSPGTNNPVFSKSNIAVTTALVAQAAALVIGVLAMTQVLPALGMLPAKIMTGGGGGLLLPTVLWVTVYHRCKKEQKQGTAVAFVNTSHALSPPANKSPLQSQNPAAPPALSAAQHPTPAKAPVVAAAKAPKAQALPTVLYTGESGQGVTALKYWESTSLDAGGLPLARKKHTSEQLWPVVASPDYAKGEDKFVLPGGTRQHVVLQVNNLVVGMDFQLTARAKFMKPNLDTMEMCVAISDLFEQHAFRRAIDVGAGSGFISKFMAAKNPTIQVTAIDIDPESITYMQSAQAGMPSNVTPKHGDAIKELTDHGSEYDLVVSNPPYVPSVAETQTDQRVQVKDASFWEGTGLMCHMLEDTLQKLPAGGHVVMVVPSTSLKGRRLAKILQENKIGLRATVIGRREVVYKAWFAGNTDNPKHLYADPAEAATPTHFAGTNLDLFVGVTPPGHPRDCRVEDGRREYGGYHWQMIYIVDFTKGVAVA